MPSAKKAKTTPGQITGFDLTISRSAFPVPDTLCRIFHSMAKSWVFQAEEGKQDKHLHYQCRLSLREKTRIGTFVKKYRPIFVNDTDVEEVHNEDGSITLQSCKGAQVSIRPTSKAVHEQVRDNEHKGSSNSTGFNYVMKADTRVEGPWSDDTWKPPPVKSEQLIEFEKYPFRPFQGKIYVFSTTKNDYRYIHYVIDAGDTLIGVGGNIGKSILVEYLVVVCGCVRVPPFRSAEDMLQYIYNCPKTTCYLIDLPRAMNKEHLSEFYAGIETVKDGYQYDKRYGDRPPKYVTRPNVIVFSNMFPQLDSMTPDRWKFHRIVGSGDEADLETIPPEHYETEDIINRRRTAHRIKQKKERDFMMSQITDDMLGSDEWRNVRTNEFKEELQRRYQIACTQPTILGEI